MRWWVFGLPYNSSRASNWPGTIAESINVDQIIGAALATATEYFQLYSKVITGFDIAHFRDHVEPIIVNDLIDDTTRVIKNCYDNRAEWKIMHELQADIFPVYNDLLENFYYAVMTRGSFNGMNSNGDCDLYIAWLDSTQFMIIEYPSRMSLSGIELAYPQLRDLHLLGV